MVCNMSQKHGWSILSIPGGMKPGCSYQATTWTKRDPLGYPVVAIHQGNMVFSPDLPQQIDVSSAGTDYCVPLFASLLSHKDQNCQQQF